MKRNDIKSLAEKSESELRKQLDDLLMALAKGRLEKMAGKLSNTASIRVMSDDIARLKTVIGQKSLATSNDKKEEIK